jgi:hypothetical protein
MTTFMIVAVGAILFIIGIAAYTMFSDPDPFASHRRAIRRAGFTFVSSAPDARTKRKPYSSAMKEGTRSVWVAKAASR